MAVEANHATKFNAGYGLAFEPVENGSFGHAGEFGGFGDVQQAVGLIGLIHMQRRRVVGVPEDAIRVQQNKSDWCFFVLFISLAS